MQLDGSLEELSTLSPLVAAITGKVSGDQRYFFPKVMLTPKDDEHWQPAYGEFQRYLAHGQIIDPRINGML